MQPKQPARILRRRVLKRLQPTAGLVVLAAPAGFGKTTAIAQWAETDDRPFAHVRVEASHADPALLMRDVVQTLAQALHLPDAEAAGVVTGSRRVWTVGMPRLLRLLQRHAPPFVLALDDVPSPWPALVEDLVSMTARLGVGRQCVVATEDLPRGTKLPAAATVLTAGDLCMDDAEVREVLGFRDGKIDARERRAVMDLTRGFPAAVYLAALEGAPYDGAATAAMSPGDLVRILATQWLDEQSPDVASFLLSTSVLDDLSGPVCDQLIKRQKSDAVLADLANSNMLVQQVADTGAYRYHSLLAAVLRQRLIDSDPSRARELHRRVAEWCDSHDDLPGAVAHAHAAGETDRAALTIWLHAAPLLTTGRRAALEAIIAGFSPDEIVAQPWLALSRAWCAVQAGEPVDAWVDAAAAAIDVAADTAEAQAVESAIALLLAVVANKGVEQMAADAERAYRLDTSDSDFRPVACFLAGTAHEMLGNGEQAAIWLEEGTRVAVLRSVPSIYAQCQAELAIVALARDDWQAVAQHAHAALTEVLRYRLAEAAAPVAPVFAVAALSAANAGDVEQAQSHTRQALLMLASLRHVGPSIRAQSRETLARTELMLGDYDAAKILVAEAEAEARRLPDAAMLHERLRRTATLLRNRPSSSAEGSRVLSTREVEVLQLLPSHLSFDAIGERLGIGGEAVQTVAVAAYRKLGVVSRTDAVERALVLGLIESPYD